MKCSSKASVVDIYSDIHYESYQHVNQMLFNYTESSHSYSARFLHRFYMSVPSIRRSLLELRKFFTKTKVIARVDSNNKVPRGVVSVRNIPCLNLLMDYINVRLVVKHALSDTAITFVPSKGLQKIFDKYDRLAYYCVHDSRHQNYHNRNKQYEELLVEQADVVFCDNEIVLKRLSKGDVFADVSIESIDNLLAIKSSGVKYFYVPSPVPKEFYMNYDSEVDFDYVYYGSLHENIDFDVIRNLDANGKKLLIITNENLGFSLSNGVILPATSDLYKLCSLISSSKSILLPYINSEFMKSISPAKLYQSIATGKEIYTTNLNLQERFGLGYLNADGDCKIPYSKSSSCCVDRYNSNIISEKIFSIVTS